MSNTHISNGKAKPCTAPPGQCPLGGEHFESTKEAERYIAETEKQKHEQFARFNRRDKTTEKKKHFRFTGEMGAAAVTAVTIVAGSGAIYAMHVHGENVQNSYNHTPYSVSSTVDNCYHSR